MLLPKCYFTICFWAVVDARGGWQSADEHHGSNGTAAVAAKPYGDDGARPRLEAADAGRADEQEGREQPDRNFVGTVLPFNPTQPSTNRSNQRTH